MRRCAFLTTDLGGMVTDDELAFDPLRRRGWSVDAVEWRAREVDWDAYETVVIRSTWDYHRDPVAFLDTLAVIDESTARLENPLPIVRWNHRKTYLLELASRGVSIVPTLVRDALGPGDLMPLLEELDCGEIVAKPVIGASAVDTHRIDRATTEEKLRAIESVYQSRGVLLQPLVRSVIEEGEYSLFFFNGQHSHTIVKLPRPDEFRVQEEHGGQIRTVVADPVLLRTAQATLATLDRSPLYARIDLARSNDDESYWLMELELIEPSLYLSMDPGSADRLAHAIDTRAGS